MNRAQQSLKGPGIGGYQGIGIEQSAGDGLSTPNRYLV